VLPNLAENGVLAGDGVSRSELDEGGHLARSHVKHPVAGERGHSFDVMDRVAEQACDSSAKGSGVIGEIVGHSRSGHDPNGRGTRLRLAPTTLDHTHIRTHIERTPVGMEGHLRRPDSVDLNSARARGCPPPPPARLSQSGVVNSHRGFEFHPLRQRQRCYTRALPPLIAFAAVDRTKASFALCASALREEIRRHVRAR
jgi:hypothetical protein